MRDHGAVEPALGREMPGVSTKTSWERPATAMPRGKARRLYLVRHDRNLAADQRVDQRRFADIGRADQRNESAPRVVRRCRSFGGRMSRAARVPSRRGAARSRRLGSAIAAIRLDAGMHQHGGRRGLLGGAFQRPSPSAGARLGSSTVTRNSGL